MAYQKILFVCITGVLLAACSDDTVINSEEWYSVFTQPLDRSVLSVMGNAADDVYLAGGGLGVGTGALALHFDGESWREYDVGTEQTLWWVWPDPQSATHWWVGEQGTVIRGTGDGFETLPSGTTAPLFGVWGTSGDDVWVVGGDVGLGGEKDLLLHWNGETLARVNDVPQRGATLFKVWGSPAGNLWIVGQGGTILRRQADGQWEDHSIDTLDSILTVHGCSENEVYAVGGQALYMFDGASWAPVAEAQILNTANGVSCGAEAVLVVGNGGLKLRLDRQSGQWINEQFSVPFDTDFHSAYAAPNGDLWATGGNFLTPADFGERTGVIGYRGSLRPPPQL